VSAYSELILSEAGLVSYWPLTDTGSTAADLKGINTGTHSGALVNQTSILTNDPDGGCVFYDGVNDFTKMANDASLDLTGDISIEGWVKAQALTDATSLNAIFARYNATNNGGFEFEVANNGLVDGDVRGGGVDSNIQSTAGDIVVSTIYYLTATFKESTDTFRIYRQGLQIKQITNATAVPGSISPTIGASIGARSSNGTTDPNQLFWEGWIGHVALYSVELSAAQALNHYTVGSNPPAVIRGAFQ
jgi:hypothetical protein